MTKKQKIYDFGTLRVTSNMSHETIKRKMDEPYSRIELVPDKYLVKYRCNRCSHEWEDILPETDLSANEIVYCIKGCSKGADGKGFMGFYKPLIGLITNKNPFGYGIMIKSRKI